MFPSFNDKSQIPASLATKSRRIIAGLKDIYRENVGNNKVSVVRVKFKVMYYVQCTMCIVQ